MKNRYYNKGTKINKERYKKMTIINAKPIMKNGIVVGNRGIAVTGYGLYFRYTIYKKVNPEKYLGIYEDEIRSYLAMESNVNMHAVTDESKALRKAYLAMDDYLAQLEIEIFKA